MKNYCNVSFIRITCFWRRIHCIPLKSCFDKKKLSLNLRLRQFLPLHKKGLILEAFRTVIQH
ncbi:hypothetical protein BpHYR1_018428 [Brachionus plicatilis]|uniref:Uncharacterized protein n=1 Tax=Brachionus plicatilis TaxID=10195 RepID=A0A3M7PK94_BRAPC|nr:hypothetical protein BpHYR1_018428 [Brachionus plicatilis]